MPQELSGHYCPPPLSSTDVVSTLTLLRIERHQNPRTPYAVTMKATLNRLFRRPVSPDASTSTEARDFQAAPSSNPTNRPKPSRRLLNFLRRCTGRTEDDNASNCSTAEEQDQVDPSTCPQTRSKTSPGARNTRIRLFRTRRGQAVNSAHTTAEASLHNASPLAPPKSDSSSLAASHTRKSNPTRRQASKPHTAVGLGLCIKEPATDQSSPSVHSATADKTAPLPAVFKYGHSNLKKHVPDGCSTNKKQETSLLRRFGLRIHPATATEARGTSATPQPQAPQEPPFPVLKAAGMAAATMHKTVVKAVFKYPPPKKAEHSPTRLRSFDESEFSSSSTLSFGSALTPFSTSSPSQPDSGYSRQVSAQPITKAVNQEATTDKISLLPQAHRSYKPRVSPISADQDVLHFSDVQVSEVKGDGRCLFRALSRCRYAAMLRQSGARHASVPRQSEAHERTAADKLRLLAVDELPRHKDFLLNMCVIDEDFDVYMARMKLPRTFGGEPELYALSNIMQAPIAVYIVDPSAHSQYRRIVMYGEHHNADPYCIVFVNKNHYDALFASPWREVPADDAAADVGEDAMRAID